MEADLTKAYNQDDATGFIRLIIWFRVTRRCGRGEV